MLHKAKSYKKVRRDRYYARLTARAENGERRIVEYKQVGNKYHVITGTVDAEGWYSVFYTAAIYSRSNEARRFCDTLIDGISGAF